MEALRKKLQHELKQQSDLEIIQSAGWGLPVQLIKVPYTTVKRTTMDILMKMILLTVQKLEITESKTMAEFLAVEPLFTENLFAKLQQAGMIRRRDGVFELTELGGGRLESGIFEHPPEESEKNYFYSACHGNVLIEETEGIRQEKLPPFRLAGRLNKPLAGLQIDRLREALVSSGAETAEGAFQAVLGDIGTPTPLAEKTVPCVEFLIYNQHEKVYFTRVWNTLLEAWDEGLEKLIDENDPLKKINTSES